MNQNTRHYTGEHRIGDYRPGLGTRLIADVTMTSETAPAMPRSKADDELPPEPVATRITTMLIEAWARHAMASSGFGG